MKKTEQDGIITLSLIPNDYIRLIDSVGNTVVLKVVDEKVAVKKTTTSDLAKDTDTVLPPSIPSKQQQSEISVECSRLGIWSDDKEKRNALTKPFVIKFTTDQEGTLSSHINALNADAFIEYLRSIIGK